MRLLAPLGFILICFFTRSLNSQTLPFQEHGKWGIKEKNQILIAPTFDTILNFDEEGKVCMACYKVRTPSPNKFIKTVTVSFSCHYLNKKNEKLRIKAEDHDTCSVFAYGKNSFKHYTEHPNTLVVTVKGKRYLVNKEFKQLTFKGYHDIFTTVDPSFYLTYVMAENESVYAGLISTDEKEIIPYHYSGIKINPVDSFIIACRAGLNNGTDDDIFNYQGKLVDSYRRHVELATKNYVIEKIFEPKEHFVIYNPKTKEERPLKADEVHFFEQDQILIKIKSDWFVYDLLTNIKTEKQY